MVCSLIVGIGVASGSHAPAATEEGIRMPAVFRTLSKAAETLCFGMDLPNTKIVSSGAGVLKKA